MQLAPLRIAQPAYAIKQHADRLHCCEAADPTGHGAQHAVLGAGVAVFGVERIANEATIAGMLGHVTGKGADLALEPPDCGRKQRNACGNASVRHREPCGEIVCPV